MCYTLWEVEYADGEMIHGTGSGAAGEKIESATAYTVHAIPNCDLWVVDLQNTSSARVDIGAIEGKITIQVKEMHRCSHCKDNFQIAGVSQPSGGVKLSEFSVGGNGSTWGYNTGFELTEDFENLEADGYLKVIETDSSSEAPNGEWWHQLPGTNGVPAQPASNGQPAIPAVPAVPGQRVQGQSSNTPLTPFGDPRTRTSQPNPDVQLIGEETLVLTGKSLAGFAEANLLGSTNTPGHASEWVRLQTRFGNLLHGTRMAAKCKCNGIVVPNPYGGHTSIPACGIPYPGPGGGATPPPGTGGATGPHGGGNPVGPFGHNTQLSPGDRESEFISGGPPKIRGAAPKPKEDEDRDDREEGQNN